MSIPDEDVWIADVFDHTSSEFVVALTVYFDDIVELENVSMVVTSVCFWVDWYYLVDILLQQSSYGTSIVYHFDGIRQNFDYISQTFLVVKLYCITSHVVHLDFFFLSIFKLIFNRFKFDLIYSDPHLPQGFVKFDQNEVV